MPEIAPSLFFRADLDGRPSKPVPGRHEGAQTAENRPGNNKKAPFGRRSHAYTRISQEMTVFD
jgi:hypothetical protein